MSEKKAYTIPPFLKLPPLLKEGKREARPNAGSDKFCELFLRERDFTSEMLETLNHSTEKLINS